MKEPRTEREAYLADYLIISVHLPPKSCPLNQPLQSKKRSTPPRTMRLGVPNFDLKEAFRYTVHFLDLPHTQYHSLLFKKVFGIDANAYRLFPPWYSRLAKTISSSCKGGDGCHSGCSGGSVLKASGSLNHDSPRTRIGSRKSIRAQHL